MKKIILLVICICFALPFMAQQTERDANFNFKAENFPIALKHYDQLYKGDTTNVEYNYRLGVCLLNCNCRPNEALKYLKFVEGDYADNAVYYHELGRAYLYNYQYSYAIESFSKAKELSQKDLEFSAYNSLWVKMANNAKILTRNPLDVSFINMGKYINSALDELTPVISSDGEVLIYTSNRKFDRNIGYYTYDVYSSVLAGSSFKKGKALSSVNSIDDDYVAGISADGQSLFIQVQGYEAFEDLAYATRSKQSYSSEGLVLGQVNSKSTERGATLTISGDTMFFSSNRPEGLGGMDIYFSRKLPTGEWGIPTNVGKGINSTYDEDFPMMSPDGKTLYFCSNNEKSMGGFDIFKTTLLSNGEFSEPKNIGFPLNDVFDNKTIAFSKDERYAYVSANRPDGFGYSDLYRIIFNQNDPSVKLYILKMKTGTTKVNEPFAGTDTTISVTVLQKGKVVFGKYSYDANSSRSTIALPPGDYVLEIEGVSTMKFTKKISVPDAPGKNKILKETVFLKPKE